MKLYNQHNSPQNERLIGVFSTWYDALFVYGKTLTPSEQLVEDCIQDLFLRLCENQNLIFNADNQLAYLKTSLRRSIIKASKDRSNTRELKLIEISEPSYEEMLIKNQDSLQNSLRIKEGLQLLSPSQKTILTMRFFRSMSYEDIADKLNITKRTVYNQIHDSIKKLRGGINNI